MATYFGPNALAVAVGSRAKLPENVPKMAHTHTMYSAFPPYGAAIITTSHTIMDVH